MEFPGPKTDQMVLVFVPRRGVLPWTKRAIGAVRRSAASGLRGAVHALDRRIEDLSRERLRAEPRTAAEWAWHHARRTVVLVVGGTILVLGVAMIIAPGPATVFIPLGLAVLASEFLWARRLLAGARRRVLRARRGASQSSASQSPTDAPGM